MNTATERLMAVGIAGPLAVEINKQFQESDGSGFVLSKANRLMALGVPPEAAKSIQTTINNSGGFTYGPLLVGNFFNGVQARKIHEIYNGFPTVKTPPTISGGTVVGDTVTITAGTWDSPTPVAHVEWNFYADGVLISGQNTNTYVLTEDEVGKMISGGETVSNRGTQANSQSSEIGPVTAT